MYKNKKARRKLFSAALAAVLLLVPIFAKSEISGADKESDSLYARYMTAREHNAGAQTPVLRGEFFRVLGFKLGIEAARSAKLVFSDYDSSDDIINGMINMGYIIGKNDGRLALYDILSLSDSEFLLGRIKWPENIREFTDYIETPVTSTVEVPVIVETPVTVEVPVYSHGMFQLGTDIVYRCVCGCGLPAPGQNGNIVKADDSELAAAPAEALSSDPADAVSAYIWIESALLEDIDNEAVYPISVNADILAADGDEYKSVGLLDFYRLFGSELAEGAGRECAVSYGLDSSGSRVIAIRIF